LAGRWIKTKSKYLTRVTIRAIGNGPEVNEVAMIRTFFIVVQIILAVLISGLILLQNQESGWGSTFGGGGENYHTKRGLERALFYLTIVLVGLFALVATFNLAK